MLCVCVLLLFLARAGEGTPGVILENWTEAGVDLEVSRGEGIFSLEVKPRLNYTHKT